MKDLTYTEKLKDPRWQKQRLEIMNRDNFRCQHCNSADKTLHIHHKYYTSIEPWEYPNTALITLCWDCHEIEEESLKSISSDFISILRQAGAESSNLRSMCQIFLMSDLPIEKIIEKMSLIL